MARASKEAALASLKSQSFFNKAVFLNSTNKKAPRKGLYKSQSFFNKAVFLNFLFADSHLVSLESQSFFNKAVFLNI
jgi:hypothetical protein